MVGVIWKASLSNGETVYEGKGQFVEVEGELSPWNKLIKYVTENTLKITSLALVSFDGRTFHVPSTGTNPHFPLFHRAEKPVDYRFFNAATSTLIDGGETGRHYRVIEAVYETHRLQMWVDVFNPRNCWCLDVKNN